VIVREQHVSIEKFPGGIMAWHGGGLLQSD
jgi:hypothetical protein